jgi:hypothetical protein
MCKPHPGFEESRNPVGDDALTPAEVDQVRRGEVEIKAGRAKSWRTVKNELDL